MPTTPNSFSPLNLNVFFSGQATDDGALMPIGSDAVGESFANLLASLAPQNDQPALPMLAADGKPLPQQMPLDDWSHVFGEDVSETDDAATALAGGTSDMALNLSADMKPDTLIGEQATSGSAERGADIGAATGVSNTSAVNGSGSLVDERALGSLGAVSGHALNATAAADKAATLNTNPSTAPLSDWLNDQQRMQTQVSQQAAATSMHRVSPKTGQSTDELASVSIAASFAESDGQGLKRPMLNTTPIGEARSSLELGASLSNTNGQPINTVTPASNPELSALHSALVSVPSPSNSPASEGFAIKTASELSVADALQMQQDQMTEANERLVFGRQPERWGGVLGARIVSMVQQDVQRAEIHLDPPELGSLEVRVRVHQGEASIQVATSHPQVRDVLESQAFRLREALAEDGMNLSHFDVGSQSQGDGSPGEQSNSGEHSEPSLAQDTFTEHEDVQSQTVLLKTDAGRLDTFA